MLLGCNLGTSRFIKVNLLAVISWLAVLAVAMFVAIPCLAEQPGDSVPRIEAICDHPLGTSESATVIPPCDIRVSIPEPANAAKYPLALIPDGSDRCYTFVATQCGATDAAKVSEAGAKTASTTGHTCLFKGFRFRIPGDHMFRDATVFAYARESTDKSAHGVEWADCRTLSDRRSKPIFIKITREQPEALSISSLQIGKTNLLKSEAQAAVSGSAPLTVTLNDAPSSYPEALPVWVLTRPVGSSLWFAQRPPAKTRGASNGWELSDLLWLHPPGFSSAIPKAEASTTNPTGETFEVLLIQTADALPLGWIAADEVAMKTDRASRTYPVRVTDVQPRLTLHLTRVGAAKLRRAENHENPSRGFVEFRVENNSRPTPYLYVARRCTAASLWEIVPAVPSGDVWLSGKELDFSGSAPRAEGVAAPSSSCSSHQLLAIATLHEIPDIISTDDLISEGISISDGVILSRRTEMEAEMSSPPSLGSMSLLENLSMAPTLLLRIMEWILLAAILIILFMLLVWLIRRIRQHANNQNSQVFHDIASRGAETLRSGMEILRPHLKDRNPGQLVQLALGIAIGAALYVGLTQYFIEFYPTVVEKVIQRGSSFSWHWAVWIILITVVAGALLHSCVAVVYDINEASKRPPFRIRALVWLGVIFLVIMQAFILRDFILPGNALNDAAFAHTAGNFILAIGALFTLIDLLAAYFALKLSWWPLKWLICEAALLVLRIPYTLLRIIEIASCPIITPELDHVGRHEQSVSGNQENSAP
jgi:hypothetical protein